MSRSINEVDKIWVAEALGKKRMNGVQDIYATDSTDGAYVQIEMRDDYKTEDWRNTIVVVSELDSDFCLNLRDLKKQLILERDCFEKVTPQKLIDWGMFATVEDIYVDYWGEDYTEIT
jgi:hypothetical protein